MDLSINIYYILALLHIVVWLIVIFAFINKKLARFNLKFIIPAVYLLQILPFHILNTLKMYFNKNSEEDNVAIEKAIGFYYLKNVFSDSFQNPLSPQGMLILGGLLSYNFA